MEHSGINFAKFNVSRENSNSEFAFRRTNALRRLHAIEAIQSIRKDNPMAKKIDWYYHRNG